MYLPTEPEWVLDSTAGERLWCVPIRSHTGEVKMYYLCEEGGLDWTQRCPTYLKKEE